MVQVQAPATSTSESAGYAKVDHSRAALLGLLVCVLIAALAIYLQNKTPEALPENAPASEFSAARALKHLEVIGARPHPMGSQEHEVVRNYIVSELARLGIDSWW